MFDDELTVQSDKEAVKIINACIKGKLTEAQAHKLAKKLDKIKQAYTNKEIDLKESIKQIKEVYK